MFSIFQDQALKESILQSMHRGFLHQTVVNVIRGSTRETPLSWWSSRPLRSQYLITSVNSLALQGRALSRLACINRIALTVFLIGLLNNFLIKYRFYNQEANTRYWNNSTEELIFISTVLKVHLYAGLFTSGGKARDCK